MPADLSQMTTDDFRSYLLKVLRDETLENMLALHDVYEALATNYRKVVEALWVSDHPQLAWPQAPREDA